MIKNMIKAASESGMSISHAHCFQKVANQTKCMIASRFVGGNSAWQKELGFGSSKGVHYEWG